MIYRLILPQWALDKNPKLSKVIEGKFSPAQIKEYNQKLYNIYYLPNYPSEYKGGTVDGAMVDTFEYVFVDCDLKDKVYADKDAFLEALAVVDIPPTKVVDSGNGVHAYWKVDGLDPMSYLRFQRRLMRLFNTDDAVGQLFQLMRCPGTVNTKYEGKNVPCELILEQDLTYTAEELNKLLPPITVADETYCKHHYDKTNNINQTSINLDEALPAKFGKLLLNNSEVKTLYAAQSDDRSGGDFRLANILLLEGFSREEALSVLVNTAKASSRSPIHRISYAENIVNKVWTFDALDESMLSNTVEEIINSKTNIEGTRFPCYRWIDDTAAGFRLGQVLGLVAGSGVGKTALALNMFKGFVASNPGYDHFFIPLEQPGREIALRWQKMCGDNKEMYKKVHIISNYDANGDFRDLSLSQIQDYILKFQIKNPDKKIGCVVIDHIGVLKNDNKLGIAEGKKHISKAMKSFAVKTNTFLIMQSQTAREKAGIGDLELNKDAAIDTSSFEHYVDYLVTMWQPLKRMYAQGAPTVIAYKFCKIRHKNQIKDALKEDECYTLLFDVETELVKQMTQADQTSFNFHNQQAVKKRSADRKTEIIPYKSIPWEVDKDGKDISAAKTNNNTDTSKH